MKLRFYVIKTLKSHNFPKVWFACLRFPNIAAVIHNHELNVTNSLSHQISNVVTQWYISQHELQLKASSYIRVQRFDEIHF